MKKTVLLTLLVLGFATCKKKNATNQAVKDDQIIRDYISANNLNATATGTGLYYVIANQGSGPQPNANSNVTVKYKGYLTNGKVFDETTNAGATFNLSGVIQGWQEGIPLFKKGGKGTLLIPSALGYGDKDSGPIPANSVLIFEVELVDVK